MKPLPPQEKLIQLFDYNANTGSLSRKERRGKFAIGSIAGTLTVNGYIQIQIGNVVYYAHRLIWCYVHGDMPSGYFIDHINGIRSDNRLSNLRLVDGDKENQQNRRLRVDSSSGYTGVYYEKNLSKWRARIHTNGKTINLGCFHTPQEAAHAYQEAKEKYHTYKLGIVHSK